MAHIVLTEDKNNIYSTQYFKEQLLSTEWNRKRTKSWERHLTLLGLGKIQEVKLNSGSFIFFHFLPLLHKKGLPKIFFFLPTFGNIELNEF